MAAVAGPPTWEQALNTFEGVFFVFTEEGEMLRWNRRVREITGYCDEEIAEMHPTQFVPVEEKCFIQAQIEKVLEEGRTQFESRLRTKDGQEIPCEFTGSLLEEGQQRLICGAGRLFSQRSDERSSAVETSATKENQSSEFFDERYRRLFETSQDGIVLTTPSGKIIDANPALCEITGYNCGELIGRQASTLYDEATRQKLVQALQEKGHVTDLEVRLHCKDGETRICLVSASLWTDKEGNAEAIQSVVRDVTEQRQLQRDLLQVQEEERRRLGQDLHDGVAAQLTGVTMMLSTLKTRLEGEYDELSSRVQKILELVNESNKDLRRVSRGLNPMVLEQGGLLTALERLVENTAECEMWVGEEVDDSTTLSSEEERQLYWIAQEGVTNARRHGDAEEIVLQLEREKGDLVLEVEDDGVGFNPSETEDEGIGLRSMRHRAALLGAELMIESTPGEGTLICCRLPI